MIHHVEIYTDGSSRGNPGPGGLGVVLRANGKQKEIAEGYQMTTNNRMELMAVIRGLEALKKEGLNVTIYSDSKYVVDSYSKGWVFGWVKKPGFGGKKNQDLWMRFLELARLHTVSFVWVKGHADNYFNNICDQLATRAADSGPHMKDAGFRPS